MPRPRIARHALLLALAVSSASLSGCLLSSDSHTHQSGNYVSPATLAAVEIGAPKEDVLGLLGEPTRRTQLKEGGEIWKWEFREVTNSRGHVFLVLSSKRRVETTGAVYVELAEDQVVKVWRD